MTQTETLDFSADVARLLDIVAGALYSNRDVFLRELVANAADACDRRRYDGIAAPALLPATPFAITLTPDPKARTLTVADNGIGMTREDLVSHLGTIARSGTRAALEQAKAAGTGGDLSLIGQFGVGFYSSFMVASTVDVVSRRAGSDQTWFWTSDGRSGYTITEATPEQAACLGTESGTAIICHIKDDASDYLLAEKITHIVKTYADHITFPIVMEGKTVNQASALWARSKSGVTPEQYKEFFGHVSQSYDLDEPMITAHWKAEGKIEFSALLFVPSLRPFDLYDPARTHSVRLYVKRVFISDKCDGLVYPWLRFLRGVIDSDDLPLNISREMLQTNPVVTRIRSAVTTRILSDLLKLAETDPVKFKAFWLQFGAVLKEGLYEPTEHREDLLKVARFYSSSSEGEFTTLADYAARMKPGQTHIYYFSGENRDAMLRSPQLEGFRARGIEVLFMTDTVDDFWIPAVTNYQGKIFRSITKGAVDLSAFPLLNAETSDKQEPANEDSKNRAEHLARLMEQTLAEHIGAVRLSDRLTSSPVCLVAGDGDVDLKMDRMLKIQQKYESRGKRVLEINPNHPVIRALAASAQGSEALEAAAADRVFMLYDQAKIIQGEPVDDPAAFADRMGKLMASP